MTENGVRQIGLDGGLVDVKIIAVDAKWSALKFVYRVKDRVSQSLYNVNKVGNR